MLTFTKPFLYCLILLFASTFLLVRCTRNRDDAEQWMPLFNGKDLEGWDVKIAGYGLNENYANTFQVQDSTLVVSYDDYPEFANQFGHLYYEKPYSYYRLRLEYQFYDDQKRGGPNYAFLNSGVMVHSQSAQSCDLNQTFPVSIEMQFLASNDSIQRPTGNLCTPGTAVHMANKEVYDHCINSTSLPLPADDWVDVEVVVLGDSLIHHIVKGDTVLTYQGPFITDYFVGTNMNWDIGGFEDSLRWMNNKGKLLAEGYIALQAESHPIRFRNIELLNLKGCRDPEATNYKSYYITHDPLDCQY